MHVVFSSVRNVFAFFFFMAEVLCEPISATTPWKRWDLCVCVPRMQVLVGAACCCLLLRASCCFV